MGRVLWMQVGIVIVRDLLERHGLKIVRNVVFQLFDKLGIMIFLIFEVWRGKLSVVLWRVRPTQKVDLCQLPTHIVECYALNYIMRTLLLL